jgi:hypothetical protein
MVMLGLSPRHTFTSFMRRMHHGATCALILALLAAGTHNIPAAYAADFLSTYDDMPVMDGLREDLDRAYAFDSASGRLVEGVAIGQVRPEDVIDFYVATLPQMGWIMQTPPATPNAPQTAAPMRLAFLRDGEKLEIEVIAGHHTTAIETPYVTVRYHIQPDA